MILIEDATLHEEQTIRSIRAQELAPAFVIHAHQHETAEERVLNDLECFRTQALQRIAASIDEVVVKVARAILGPDRQINAVELHELVQRELRRCDRESPVRLRVAAADVTQVVTELPIIADAAMGRGELVLEMLEGETSQQIPVQLSCSMTRMLRETRY